jgi:tRNA1(Val) A37 N6-methylase TrmN6
MMVFYQPIDGYCYNSDTHCLFHFITQNLKTFKNIKGELLDIGSGSGILGLLVSNHYEKLSLNSSEIQDEFVFLTNKNAQVNNLTTNVYQGDFTTMNFDKQFDIVVSNPPFYPSSVVQSENQNIKTARYNDNMPLNQFITKTAKVLSNKGKFFFCYDVKLLNDIITNLKENNLNIEALQFLHPKKEKDASLVMVYARKNSKSLLKVLPPIVMFKDNDFSFTMQNIYDLCATYSIKAKV